MGRFFKRLKEFPRNAGWAHEVKPTDLGNTPSTTVGDLALMVSSQAALPPSFLSSYLSSFSPSSVLWLVFCPLNTGDWTSFLPLYNLHSFHEPSEDEGIDFTTAVQQLNIEARPSDGAF